MKFYSRAVRYVLKKKSKTLILLLIMTIAGSIYRLSVHFARSKSAAGGDKRKIRS